jgi:hypothetical protein
MLFDPQVSLGLLDFTTFARPSYPPSQVHMSGTNVSFTNARVFAVSAGCGRVVALQLLRVGMVAPPCFVAVPPCRDGCFVSGKNPKARL